jgi:hypothetical protein
MLQKIKNVKNGCKGRYCTKKSEKVRKNRNLSEMFGLSLNKKDRNT